jgi:hypothetical protein
MSEDGKLYSFSGHARKVSGGRYRPHPKKTQNKHADMTEGLLELDEWLLFSHFIILI